MRWDDPAVMMADLARAFAVPESAVRALVRCPETLPLRLVGMRCLYSAGHDTLPHVDALGREWD